MSPRGPSTAVARVLLKPRRARPFFGRHPWVFAGAIGRVEGEPADGAEADLYSHEGQFIARGLFNSHSTIRLRLYSWEADQPLDAAFWQGRLEAALHLRGVILDRLDAPGACRLVFSEGDGLSGLVVDRYGLWLVVQFTSLAIAQRRDTFVQFLVERLRPEGIYLRTERGIGEAEGLALADGPLWGTVPPVPIYIEEDGIRYAVDLQQGQKTGFFLDQRENRAAAAFYAKTRRVLDAFCYTGAFGLAAALKGNAREVFGFDVSEAAIALARANMELNKAANTRFETGEAFETLARLREAGERFGVVILDPPRFARHPSALPEAVRAHQRLSHLAVDLLEPDGILVTCSCSGYITRDIFEGVLAGAAEQTRRPIQILERRGQAPDHPVSASCPEGDYLKCYICRVR